MASPITLRLDPELRRRVTRIAKRKQTTTSEVLREAIATWVEREDSSGSLLGHIVLYRDVTHEVEVEKAKTEFVSMVSHELRTPMTSVKTSLTLLVEGAGGRLDPAAHELLEVALRNADRLIRLVNDLLDLSRLEAGRMDLRVEPVAVADARDAGYRPTSPGSHALYADGPLFPFRRACSRISSIRGSDS